LRVLQKKGIIVDMIGYMLRL